MKREREIDIRVQEEKERKVERRKESKDKRQMRVS